MQKRGKRLVVCCALYVRKALLLRKSCMSTNETGRLCFESQSLGDFAESFSFNITSTTTITGTFGYVIQIRKDQIESTKKGTPTTTILPFLLALIAPRVI